MNAEATATSHDASSAPPVGVELVALHLHGVEFKIQGRGSASTDTQLQLSLRATRPSETDLIAQLSFQVDAPGAMHARITYGARFRRAVSDPQASDEFWQQVAARLAPIVVYPYVRALLGFMTAQTPFATVTLPIMNIGGVIDPNTVTIQPVEAETE